MSEKKAFKKYGMEGLLERNKLWLLLTLIAALLLLPHLGFSQYILRILIVIAVYAILAQGLNLLIGYTGQLSLGHAGFFAIGAYAASLLTLRLDVNFFPALLLGAALSGVCGLLLGLPTMRLSGTYLAIVTLGFGEVVKMVIMNWESVTNGTLGLKGIPKPELFGVKLTLANNGLYYLALALAVLTTVICVLITRSRVGRAWRAIKTDELAANMMGIPSTRYKILAFVLSAILSGLAGGFYATVVGYIDHNSFSFDVSILIVSIVILGGMGTTAGMYLGAALLVSFPEIARPFMEWRFVVYGLVLILMMRFRPQGLLGFRSRLPYPLPRVEDRKGAQTHAAS